ncbi:hypothetical protein D3C87_2097440 [compost metagenome]
MVVRQAIAYPKLQFIDIFEILQKILVMHLPGHRTGIGGNPTVPGSEPGRAVGADVASDEVFIKQSQIQPAKV